MTTPNPDAGTSATARRPALLKEIPWIIVAPWAPVLAMQIPLALMPGAVATASLITIIGCIAIAFASFLSGTYCAAWLLVGAIPHIDQPARPDDC